MHRRVVHYVGSIFLAAALIAPVAITGCGSDYGCLRFGARRDHHKWDDHEETVYKGYLSDNHKDYKPIQQASPDEQKSYWDWRHNNQNK